MLRYNEQLEKMTRFTQEEEANDEHQTLLMASFNTENQVITLDF